MTRVWEPILDLTPVSGKWSISSPGKANYCGEREGPIGVCASKTPFVEGELCVQVRLEEGEGHEPSYVRAGLLLGYRSLRDTCVAVGLGDASLGYIAGAFDLNGWVPQSYAASGPVKSHKDDCRIHVYLQGHRVELRHEGERPLTYILDGPLGSTTFALFAGGRCSVVFKGLTMRSAPWCLMDGVL